MSELTLRERFDESRARLEHRDRFGDEHLEGDLQTVIAYAEREARMVIALATVCEDACEPPDYAPRSRNGWIAWAILVSQDGGER